MSKKGEFLIQSNCAKCKKNLVEEDGRIIRMICKTCFDDDQYNLNNDAFEQVKLQSKNIELAEQIVLLQQDLEHQVRGRKLRKQQFIIENKERQLQKYENRSDALLGMLNEANAMQGLRNMDAIFWKAQYHEVVLEKHELERHIKDLEEECGGVPE